MKTHAGRTVAALFGNATSLYVLATALACAPAFAQTSPAPVPAPALAPTPAAPPQDSAATPQAASPADIVVTGTRITSSGFNAPTPTTVIGEDQILKNAQPNIFNAIAQLPSLQGSTGASTGTFSTSSGT